MYHYSADDLGTAHDLAEVLSGQSNASLCYDSDFYPFGGERSPIANSCTTSQNYKFTGKERDTESGLDNFGARYYSSGSSLTGRFLSPDWAASAIAVPYAKFGDPQSLNLYSYVLNNPADHFDPDGHNCQAKSGCTIQVQVRAFIPQENVGIGKLSFTGDARKFSTDPKASSRVAVSATINTDPNTNGGKPLQSTQVLVSPTHFNLTGQTEISTGPEMPQVTATQDKNGNTTVNLQENMRNPFQPVGQGIMTNLNITVPQDGSAVTVQGKISGSPSFEVNISSETGPTVNVPINTAASGSIGFAVNLERTKDVDVEARVP